MVNLFQIWKSKGKILEGIANYVFKKDDVEVIAAERQNICRSNICGYDDPFGISEKAVVKGVDSCGACGCVKKLKIRTLSSACGLNMIGKEPLWNAVLTESEEQKLKEKLSY